MLNIFSIPLTFVNGFVILLKLFASLGPIFTKKLLNSLQMNCLSLITDPLTLILELWSLRPALLPITSFIIFQHFVESSLLISS